MVWPPQILIAWPVMPLARSDALNILFFAQVYREAENRQPQLFDIGFSCFNVSRVASSNNHPGTVSGQVCTDGFANSGPTTGHDGHFVS